MKLGLLVAALGLLGVLTYLILSGRGERAAAPESEVSPVEPVPPLASPERRPSAAERQAREAVRRIRPAAAPADPTGAAAEPAEGAAPQGAGEEAVPEVDPRRARLARAALSRQVEMYRNELGGLRERAEKLKTTFARLQREGKLTPEQAAQFQRQIQQLSDAEPRMKATLAELEQRLEKDRGDSGEQQGAAGGEKVGKPAPR